jgi:hypothetical protein
VSCLEKQQSVMVAAHTSAGKTAVAEYAIAMALRDNQRVVYTSPIKALSNQKFRELTDEFQDVGLMTGDVTINPDATLLVMTTEILRSMLYRGSELVREVVWIIYDEVHYMRDRERGVVWEESIVMVPSSIRFVFLSATLPNAPDFASWVARVHMQPCNVIYTDYRPTPLQHYMFPAGGDGLHLVVDEEGTFREENFHKCLAKLDSASANNELAARRKAAGGGGRGGPGGAKKRGGEGGSDIYKIVRLIVDKNFDPVIVFCFSKKDCEALAVQLSKLDFNSEDEKANVRMIFQSATDSLSPDDRQLPSVVHFLPLLEKVTPTPWSHFWHTPPPPSSRADRTRRPPPALTGRAGPAGHWDPPLGAAPDPQRDGRDPLPGGPRQGALRDRDLLHGAQHARENVRVHGRAQVGRRGVPLGHVRRVHPDVRARGAPRAGRQGHRDSHGGREDGAGRGQDDGAHKDPPTSRPDAHHAPPDDTLNL